MPPSPIRPMNSPCPIHSGHGEPSVEITSPRPIISPPQITVQRVPTRSAMRLIMMPPTPEPSQASALASAGIERVPPTSPAMSLSATAVIQAAPNAIIMIRSATEATIQESLVSIEEDDCSMNVCPGRIRLTDRSRIDHCAELRSAARIGPGCPDKPPPDRCAETQIRRAAIVCCGQTGKVQRQQTFSAVSSK